MKNYIFILASIMLFSCGNKTKKQNHSVIGIEFSSESFEKAIKISKELNKPIFIDFSTSWCGPCKHMDSFVFTDSIIGDFYNKNFICLKYDAEKGEGITLANKFKIKGYPTLLFLSPQLEIELKHAGYRDTKEFLELGYTVVNEKSLYHTIPSTLPNDKPAIKDLIEFNSFLSLTNEFEKDSDLFDYYKNIPKNKWYTPQYFHLIENNSYSIFSPLSKFVVVNRNKYSELYGKERIDKFISRLMSFAFETPKKLYGKSFNNHSDDEINKSLFSELTKIDSVIAGKNKLDHEIILLCKNIRENYSDTEIWDSLYTKVEYYNKHYSHFDKEWYNLSNDWSLRAVKIASNDLEKKNYNEIILKHAKSSLNESDYNEFAEGLSIGTVYEFVSSKKQSKNSKKELTIALGILAKSHPISKVLADQFISKINVSNKDIINYKEEILKNAL
ncbi:thioredoxin family protein [uncultured Maribacter sp.]|uniref:thioredoxin family protein n=1 Tax=uncultured Maribacter sp. TaxID=431308 RepID=UPI002629AA4F|nr:thioredoxin family protein [uncultured Maribacter sp.]